MQSALHRRKRNPQSLGNFFAAPLFNVAQNVNLARLFRQLRHGLLDPNASPKSLFELPHQSRDELFAIHHYGFGLLKDWAAQATAADLKKTFSRGEIRASYRKCFLQVLEHNTRHLAQLAVALRQAGHRCV